MRTDEAGVSALAVSDPSSVVRRLVLARPGGDLLFRGLSRSTIGAEGFHGRVRDGIGCLAPRHDHQAKQRPEKLSVIGSMIVTDDG